MSDLVLVLHENGIIAPVSRTLAETRNLHVVEGDAAQPNGRPVKPVRANGRPVKPRRNLDPLDTPHGDEARKGQTVIGGQPGADPDDPKTSDADASDEAVTPTEGAADSTLTNHKE